MEVSECMYGRLEFSSLLSSSKTMAAAASCGVRRGRAQPAARQREGRRTQSRAGGVSGGVARPHQPRPKREPASSQSARGHARTGQRVA